MDFFKTLINSIKHWVKQEIDVLSKKTNSQLADLENEMDSALEEKQPKGDYALLEDIPSHTWDSLPDKPFYEEVELLPYNFYDGDDDEYFYQVSFRDEYSYETGTYRLEKDATYRVNFDNNIYECTATVVDEYTIVGNMALVSSLYENNGLPFAIRESEDSEMVWLYAEDNTIYHVIYGVWKKETTLKTIDSKFLPDDHINSLIDAKLGVIENGTY